MRYTIALLACLSQVFGKNHEDMEFEFNGITYGGDDVKLESSDPTERLAIYREVGNLDGARMFHFDTDSNQLIKVTTHDDVEIYNRYSISMGLSTTSVRLRERGEFSTTITPFEKELGQGTCYVTADRMMNWITDNATMQCTPMPNGGTVNNIGMLVDYPLNHSGPKNPVDDAFDRTPRVKQTFIINGFIYTVERNDLFAITTDGQQNIIGAYSSAPHGKHLIVDLLTAKLLGVYTPNRFPVWTPSPDIDAGIRGVGQSETDNFSLVRDDISEMLDHGNYMGVMATAAKAKNQALTSQKYQHILPLTKLFESAKYLDEVGRDLKVHVEHCELMDGIASGEESDKYFKSVCALDKKGIYNVMMYNNTMTNPSPNYGTAVTLSNNDDGNLVEVRTYSFLKKASKKRKQEQTYVALPSTEDGSLVWRPYNPQGMHTRELIMNTQIAIKNQQLKHLQTRLQPEATFSCTPGENFKVYGSTHTFNCQSVKQSYLLPGGYFATNATGKTSVFVYKDHVDGCILKQLDCGYPSNLITANVCHLELLQKDDVAPCAYAISMKPASDAFLKRIASS